MKLLDVIAKIDAMILLLPTKFHEVLIVVLRKQTSAQRILGGPIFKKGESLQAWC
jgi:hypothetical protein